MSRARRDLHFQEVSRSKLRRWFSRLALQSLEGGMPMPTVMLRPGADEVIRAAAARVLVPVALKPAHRRGRRR